MFAGLVTRLVAQSSSMGLRYYARVTGNVKFFDSVKGFGFITADDGTVIFVHQTAIQTDGFRSLAEGEAVEFDIQSKPDQPNKRFAARVTGPDGASVKVWFSFLSLHFFFHHGHLWPVFVFLNLFFLFTLFCSFSLGC